MKASIRCVYDEGAVENEPLIGAKGSAYIVDCDGIRLLFNAGLRTRYLENNLENMGIDVNTVDIAVVSAPAKDLYGGIDAVMFGEGRKALIKLILPRAVMNVKNIGPEAGMPDASNAKEIIDAGEDWYPLSEHMFLTPYIPFGASAEKFLVIKARRGPVVLAGAGYPGPDRLFSLVREKFGAAPCMYIGGLDLSRKEKGRAEQIAKLFTDSGCSPVWLNHNMDPRAITLMRTFLTLDDVRNFYVGMTKELDL